MRNLLAVWLILGCACLAQISGSPGVTGGTTATTDFNGGVYVDGTGGRFPDLCAALSFLRLNINNGLISKSRIYDFNKYEMWGTNLDPFNAATCGNGTASQFASIYFGNGVFVNGTGGSITPPTGTELYFQGRAAETSISSTNGCQAAGSAAVQCIGTLLIAYNTAAPFNASPNILACPGSCTVLPSSTPVILFGTASFGSVLQGPGTVSCAGISGSTGIKNAQAQEQSYVFHMSEVGCQSFGMDWNGAAAQNSWIDDNEILSGNLTGATIGTPPAFIGMRISVNAPNRHYGNFTCNTRGAATTVPIAACVQVINSRGGRIHDIHYENANYGVVVDGSSNVLIQNINNSATSVDSSTPVAMIKNCAAASGTPCSSGTASTNLIVQGLQRTAPNITANAVVDDVTGATITWANWTGQYNQAVPQFGAFSATVTIGSGTSTSNGTAIAAGSSQAQPAITITGATVTDVATCSLNASPVATWQTGIGLLWVVTANTVTPWLTNGTAGSITPAATAIRCTATR